MTGVLVTGAGGFVGRHLLAELARNRVRAVAFDVVIGNIKPQAEAIFEGDLRDASLVDRVVSESRCDACIHLGGIASWSETQSDPNLAYAVNFGGTLNLLESFRKHRRDARFLMASTAHVYGVPTGDGLVAEDAVFAPNATYGASKAAADLATLSFAAQYGMHTMTARPNNHIGPGQSERFFVAAIAAQVRSIAARRAPPVLKVGNLDSVRDITDVRDVVRAYRLLLESGHSGNAYNISSTVELSVREVIAHLCDLAGIKPSIEVDPAKFRPTDRSPRLDTARILAHTGWKPAIPLDDTLRDILKADR